MRRIERSNQFKKDFKRIMAGRPTRYVDKIDSLLYEIVTLLAHDMPLPEKNRDHALTGNWKDFRDCHIKPDMVLIYKKTDGVLHLARIGSHSELGL